ncbi:MAG TPA: SgcJ/EcaC family oxidoreductase, partial [Longimicrobiaceae bacterium]|nr:SgcJ/EcaC family oxidoreductase [Longimicrobiaceae bacterium]
GGATPSPQSAPAPIAAPAVSNAIVQELQTSADAWNAGDLEGFLRPYLDSPATTFWSSAGLLHGKDAIRSLYRNGYWKNGRPSQQLRFDGLEVRSLGTDYALATGRYHLFEAGRETASGPFSLVFTRTPDGWRIVHDHSS